MRTNPIQPISFSGLKIEGTVSAGNIKRLNEFAKIFEQNDFIGGLEKEFNTDIVLNSQIDTVTFSHEKYGSLSKYINPSPINDLLSQMSELTLKIKTAVRKAEKEYLNSMQSYETSRRGC